MSYRRSLKRSIVIGSILFIAVLCVMLGLSTYNEYRNALYSRYEAYITDMLTYVNDNIDADDLRECVESGKKSAKYKKLQHFMDNVKDNHNIDFLYIVIPLHPGENDNMKNVIAAQAKYEYADLEATPLVELGSLTGDSYPAETAEKYYDARFRNEITFFEDVTEWGTDYTGILPIRTSDGNFLAELCVDVPVTEIRSTITRHMMTNVAIIVAMGVLFMIAFVAWSTRSVIDPIRRLESSVVGFVSQNRSGRLRMKDPEIHTNNEIESLSAAVMKMADDINDYVDEIVEAHRVAAEMSERANKDALTGIRNKGAFAACMQDLQDRLDKGESTEFAIVTFDCNDLKGINDLYGHDKGDVYLKEASKLICSIYKHSPVFRIGGDEFVVLLEGEDYQNRSMLWEKFEEESRKACQKAENEWEQIRVSGGVAVYDRIMDRTVSDTVKRADNAMYESKRAGKAKEMHRDENVQSIDDKYWNERYIVDSFKTALEQGWFKVYYQPIMRIKTGKMVMLEALARWIDPVRGMIPPDEFIPVLSRLHRLYLLDSYMIEAVCSEFGVRREAGLPMIPVSVNFSRQDFDYIDVPEKLKECVDKYGLTPDDIIVEITEQDIAEVTDQFRNALRRIRENGFKLWIDDFGSGYSSLNVLSQYDIDRIKFDMDLVRHLNDNNGANKKILQAMVEVCHELGIGTLAEGVEKEEQLDFLKSIECDLAQGFYFYRPDPTDVSIFKFQHREKDIPHETVEERKELGADVKH